MTYLYEWWTPDGQVLPDHEKGSGIRIAMRSEGSPYRGAAQSCDLDYFRNEVKICLKYIYLTDSGKKVLDLLNSCTGTVSINPATYGMGYLSKKPEHSYKKVVSTLNKGSKSELISLFDAANYDVKKFVKYFSEIPRYTQTSAPPFNWTSFKNKIQRNAPGPVGFKLDREKAWDWIEQWIKEVYSTAPLITQKDHIRNSLSMTLYDVSPDNFFGSDVDVMYIEARDDQGIADRPSAVGLAHELVHAYYSILGQQPSGEDRILDDLLCIGLGPWQNINICDNKIRVQWNQIVYNDVPSGDKGNRKKVGLRKSHADMGRYRRKIGKFYW